MSILPRDALDHVVQGRKLDRPCYVQVHVEVRHLGWEETGKLQVLGGNGYLETAPPPGDAGAAQEELLVDTL
eukprot:758443-Hanusia_phi.AAC.1